MLSSLCFEARRSVVVSSSGTKQFAQTAIVRVDKRDRRDPDHAQVRGEEGRDPTGAETEAAGERFNAAPAVVVNPQRESDPCRC